MAQDLITPPQGTALKPEEAQILMRPLPAALTPSEHSLRLADMAAIFKHIWTLYDAGSPLFTRSDLLSIDHQLDLESGVRSGKSNTVIHVRGLDGHSVPLATEAGTILQTDAHPDIVTINIEPHIDYWNIERLTSMGRWHIRQFRPEHALLPLRIDHSREARYRDPADGIIRACGSKTVGGLARELATGMISDGAGTPPLYSPRCRRTAAEAGVFLREEQDKWEASKSCRTLRATLVQALGTRLRRSKGAGGVETPTAVGSGLVIRKIVAFALASFADASARDSSRYAAQHAMVLTVRDVVEKLLGRTRQGGETVDPDNRIACFVQDPGYTSADVDALANAGVTVLRDPHGFLAVDETTIVVTVAPSVPVRQIIADLARPAAMLWTRVLSDQDDQDEGCGSSRMWREKIEDRGGWRDPPSPRVKAMVRGGGSFAGNGRECGYTEWPFPPDDRNFSMVIGMAIYVRKGQPRSIRACSNSAGNSSGEGLLHQLRRRLSCQWA